MRPPASPGTVALAACLCVCLVAPATAPAAAGDRLVVDADGAGYDAVAPAVAAADPGDTVVVRPGRYHPSVVLDRSVTVVAPDGATLAGTGGREGAAFTIPRGSDAAPTVAGFTVVDYGGGLLLAERTTGDWRLRDLTVGNVSYVVVATHATGDWTLRNVTATGGGVLAPSSTGDWTVRNLTLRDTGGRALYTAYAEGDWTVRGARLRRVDRAVDAHGTDGDWTVAATTVRNATVGVDAEGAGGDWTVRRSRFVDVAAADGEFGRGTTVLAADTGGEWTVTRSAFVDGDADEPVVDATGARPDGDATDNWWGHPAGPDPPDCVGAVDCGAALRATPTAGAGVVGPGADGATPAPPETTAGTTATPDAGRTAGVDTGPDDGEPAVTPGPETATPGPETATTTAGSLALSPVPAAVALVLAGLVGALAGRIRP